MSCNLHAISQSGTGVLERFRCTPLGCMTSMTSLVAAAQLRDAMGFMRAKFVPRLDGVHHTVRSISLRSDTNVARDLALRIQNMSRKATALN